MISRHVESNQGIVADDDPFEAFVNLKRNGILLASLLFLRVLEHTGSQHHFVLALTATILSIHVKRIGSRGCNKLILPVHDHKGDEIVYAGKTYELWANQWWIWAWSFNDTISPVRDMNGEYANQLQPEHVFFLAGSYGLTNVVRYVSVPTNKFLFIPIFNHVSFLIPEEGEDWYEFLMAVAADAGVSSPSQLSDSELTSTYLASYCKARKNINVTLQVDGCELDPKQNGLIWTKPDHTFVLPVNAETGSPPGNHAAAQCGFYVMLAPLNDGYHKIHFSAQSDASDPSSLVEFPSFSLEVTYHINFFRSFVSK